jgi:adenosylcobinamide-GDP ribazoletransferase
LLFALIFASNALILFVLSLLSFYFVLNVLNKKFGFVNGDCLGFTLEHTELLLLNIGLMIIL